MHWKKMESITAMNNKVEFTAQAHNLLLKVRASGEDRQAHKSKITNI